MLKLVQYETSIYLIESGQPDSNMSQDELNKKLNSAKELQ